MQRVLGEIYRRKAPVIKHGMVVAHVYSVGYADGKEQIIETRRMVPPKRVTI